MNSTQPSSTQLARTVVAALLSRGAKEAVLSPGSRSGPLALALYEADKAGRLRLHVRVDERSAGFLALGLSKYSRLPVPVVTTSGTAVANLHPAVLEALHAKVRLVVISADRPASLRGTGANQTTDQVEFFRGVPYAGLASTDEPDPAAVDALLDHAGRGPCQLNLELDEPLLEPCATWDIPVRPEPEPEAEREAGPALAAGPRTVVVAGDDSNRHARLLAQRAGWPLFAEPSSGSRTGDHALTAYRLLLPHSPLTDQIERVIVFGHPTLSRPVTSLLARTDLDIVVVGEDLRAFPHRGERVTLLRAAPKAPAPDGSSWLDDWREADRRAIAAVDGVLAGQGSLTSYGVARTVAASVPDGGMLFVGSSSPIRDLDLMARPFPVGGRRLVIANRGLSGIDGTLSTAIGAALGRDSSTAFAYVGDLTFLHDVNGLLIGPGEPRPDLTIIVASDDGGSIFSMLEQGAPDYAESFERIYSTPTGASIAGVCAAYGIPHGLSPDVESLTAALAQPADGIRVVEVPLARASRRALSAALADAVRRVSAVRLR